MLSTDLLVDLTQGCLIPRPVFWKHFGQTFEDLSSASWCIFGLPIWFCSHKKHVWVLLNPEGEVLVAEKGNVIWLNLGIIDGKLNL